MSPSLDSAGWQVNLAWQEKHNAWWKSRGRRERVTDELPDISKLFQLFATEAEAIAQLEVHGKRRPKVLPFQRQQGKRDYPSARVILHGFSWSFLRSNAGPVFSGPAFDEWIRNEGIEPWEDSDDIVEDMIKEGEAEIDGAVDPRCFLLDDEEFEKKEKSVTWRRPGQNPWPEEAPTPFDAAILKVMAFFARFGPLPADAFAKLCESWQLHWMVIRYADDLADSKTAQRLGASRGVCRRAGWQIRAALNGYAEEISEQITSLKPQAVGTNSTGATEPSMAPLPSEAAATSRAEIPKSSVATADSELAKSAAKAKTDEPCAEGETRSSLARYASERASQDVTTRGNNGRAIRKAERWC